MRTRDLEGRWYDVFADWTLADQAAALKVLEALHRQKEREEKREPALPRPPYNAPMCVACSTAKGYQVHHTPDSPEHERMAGGTL